MDFGNGGGGDRPPPPPEYTEFGIKIHKLRLTLKVQKRASSAGSAERPQQQQLPPPTPNEADTAAAAAAAARRRRNRRPRSHSRASTSTSSASLSESIKLLDLDPSAGSRRPVSVVSGGGRLANWEFQGFYNSPATAQQRTATPSSSGYSSEAVSRTSSFSSASAAGARLRDHAIIRQTRLHSADDSVYSDVYSTIDEELADPFDDDEHDEAKVKASKRGKRKSMKKGKSTTELAEKPNEAPQHAPPARHEKTKSMSSLAVPVDVSSEADSRARSMTSLQASRMGSTHTIVAAAEHKKTMSSCSLLTVTNIPTSCSSSPPPLPPRASKWRPPARPPYPSSLVRAVLEIADPIDRM